MFGTLFSSRKSVKTPRRARPSLETLEGREVPASLSLAVTYGHAKSITLSGTLTDHNNPSMQTINLTGKASGMTMTNAQGQFSVTVDATELGNVTATVGDASANATVTLTDVTPTLTLVADEGTSNIWSFSGEVSSTRSRLGMTIEFGGLHTLTTAPTTLTDSDGEYEYIVMLNGLSSDNGTAQARAKTAWGTYSAWATADVHQSGT